MVKAVVYERANGNTTHLVVPEKDVVIGRGFMQCDDKRVSRNHGVIGTEIAAGEITVYIKALHPTNPIFYRKQDATSDSVLRKDESLFLATGDKFRLTPDGDWFSIVETEETVKTEQPDTETQEMEDMEAIVNVPVQIAQEGSSNEVALKRKHEDESASEDVKRNRVDSDEAMPSSSSEAGAPASLSTNSELVEPLLNIKPDPDAHIPNSTSIASSIPTPAQPDEKSLASASTPQVNIKSDPDGGPSAASVASGIVVKSPADSGALRPSCDFGIRCYRGGSDHRTSFAHPGDPDYRRPNFPPAPLDAPFCPFGTRCYRRNPAHFREYQHPDPSAVVLPRPRRVAVRLDPINFDEYGEDDEYDQDFDASSSDEYSPGMYDDDDGEAASESEDEGLGCIDSGFQD